MFPLSRFRVEDRSMEPTLRAGDYILVNRWAYRRREPAPGDIVVLKDPEAPDRCLVKRVLSGAPASGYFVEGDNAEQSRDSRHFGPVQRQLIVGKVRVRARVSTA